MLIYNFFCDPSGDTYNQTPGSNPSGNPVFNSLIGGGCCNYIASGTNFSSIFSGLNNCLSGSCSSILGGSGNCDNGIKYAGIFGCNITAVANCAFHANNFVAQDMYCVAAGTILPPLIPPGTFYYMCCVGALCPIFIA